MFTKFKKIVMGPAWELKSTGFESTINEIEINLFGENTFTFKSIFGGTISAQTSKFNPDFTENWKVLGLNPQ